MRLGHWKSRVAGALLGVIVLWMTNGAATAQAEGVEFRWVGIPDGGKVTLSESFVATLEASSGEQEVDTAVVYISFDPDVLQVNPDSITVGADLDFALEEIGSSFYALDNVGGTFSYQAGKLGGSASGTFALFSLEFMAVSLGETYILALQDPDNDLYTAALRAGIDLLASTDSAKISVAQGTGPSGPDDGPGKLYLPLIALADGSPVPMNASASGVLPQEDVAAEPELPAHNTSHEKPASVSRSAPEAGEPQTVFLPIVLKP